MKTSVFDRLSYNRAQARKLLPGSQERWKQRFGGNNFKHFPGEHTPSSCPQQSLHAQDANTPRRVLFRIGRYSPTMPKTLRTETEFRSRLQNKGRLSEMKSPWKEVKLDHAKLTSKYLDVPTHGSPKYVFEAWTSQDCCPWHADLTTLIEESAKHDRSAEGLLGPHSSLSWRP